jgi:iron complex outermembrane receptor protein
LALSANLEQSAFNVVTTLNYRSGFENTMLLTQSIGGNTSTFTSQVAGFWTLDVTGRWQASKAWNLAAGIQNLTDRNPSIVLNSYSYFTGVDTRYANYYGRTLKLKAEYKF